MSVSDLPPAGLILRRSAAHSIFVTRLDEAVALWAYAAPTRYLLRQRTQLLNDALLLGADLARRLPVETLATLTPDERAWLVRHPVGAIVPGGVGVSVRYFADARRCAAVWARLVLEGS